ncbi:GNAT family N-acetyltransferase [Parasedimentitalea psychrophila]|uniref:GNAT family N-acetyltransferase n=1 Tax=Parasedimentitalea psychrophila TaxID=2997337 RepID=A0A9Y2L1R7_9RHOB|nr:GNAT family N-acetyltransferase [Parasedimentitalea psychrophila]WIY27116.1 GNAT family N-acetyltransferase [Parasedimentitalea psychrophila]
MSTDPRFYAVAEATWPCARKFTLGPITLREGRGGGSRVSSATVNGPVTDGDIAAAEAAMRDMGQVPLFMIRDGEDGLDAQLAARGYQVKDPVNLWSCPASLLTDIDIPPVTTFCVWEPLAIQVEIWAAGGIGPQRLAVMEQVEGPKTSILSRGNEQPAGTAFCAIHDGMAMVYALEILPHQRRQGMGLWMMRQAAFWARDNGAEELALMCTKRNTGANGLYASLGMTAVGQYHYRILSNGD